DSPRAARSLPGGGSAPHSPRRAAPPPFRAGHWREGDRMTLQPPAAASYMCQSWHGGSVLPARRKSMTDQARLEGVPRRHWHPLPDGRVQCDVCPRYCKLHEGQRGLCFVRARQDDQIALTTYGRSSGFCLDPIEKKPLNHFLPGTAVLSFGTAG